MSLTDEIEAVSLLKETLLFARKNVPYYREKLSEEQINNLDSVSGLLEFPILTRDLFSDNSLRLLSSKQAPHFSNCTSGSTWKTGKRLPLLHFHSEGERVVASELIDLYKSDLDQSPLVVHLISSIHGYSHLHGHQGCFDLPLERKHHFEMLTNVFLESFEFENYSSRVQVLAGTLNMLKLLTMLCIQNNVDSSKFEIQLITSAGSWLTRRWREILNSYWGVEIDNIYGLSEVNGFRCRVCKHCGGFHSASTSIVEFLDHGLVNSVDSGVANVVVTPLFPVSQYQMLVRYETEDVVDVIGECEVTGKTSFHLLGRKNDIIWLDDNVATQVPLLSPSQWVNVLDEFPDIAIKDSMRAKLLGIDEEFGNQKYEFKTFLNKNVQFIDLEVELNWNPRLYLERANKLSKAIQDRLVDSSYFLSDQIKKGKVELRINLKKSED